MLPVWPETEMVEGYTVAAAGFVSVMVGSWSPIEVVLENVVSADAGEASKTAGAATIVRATQICKTLDILPRAIAYPLRP